MKITVRLANLEAEKLYRWGLASGHGSFPPASSVERKRLIKGLKVAQEIKIPSSYDTFVALKESILFDKPSFSAFFKHLRETLKRIHLSASPSAYQAKKNQQELESLINIHAKNISAFFKRKGIQESNITVFIVPGFGERGESLIQSIVIGEEMKSDIAFLITLEELLHIAIRNWPKAEAIKKKLAIKNPNLAEESLVGALLFHLFQDLKISSPLSESVVFGWHGGKRRQFVRKAVNLI